MWWPFKKRKNENLDPETQQVVNYSASYAVKHLEKEGLITLYVGGSILSKDQNTFSDIDLFGIVSQNFDLRQEKQLNEDFKSQKDNLCRGFLVRFKAIPLNVLNGDKPQQQDFTPYLFIKRIPFFTHFWGKKFNPDRDFDIMPLSLKQEAEYWIKKVNYAIIDLKGEREKFPYWDFPKYVLNLVMVEAQHDYHYKFHPSYSKLADHLKKYPLHIIHQAILLRSNAYSLRKEILFLCNNAEKYVEELQQKVQEW